MKKITRQAQVLIFAIMIVIFLIAAFLLFKPTSEEKKVDQSDQYSISPVSYTHLDVYKRQSQFNDWNNGCRKDL